MVDDDNKMRDGAHFSRNENQPAARRSSRIVHDERGNARLEWIEVADASRFGERVSLTVMDDGADSRGTPAFQPQRTQSGVNPYQRAGARPSDDVIAPPRAKRDLRKLSEWIRVARETAERKARGEETE